MVEDGVHQVPHFRAPIWCPSGGGGTREARSTGAESLVGRSNALSGEYAPYSARKGAARSPTSQGGAEPLCAKITGANREASEGKAYV